MVTGVAPSATAGEPAGFPAWAVRRAVWFLVAVHLPFVVFVPLTVITRRPGIRAGEITLILAGSLAVAGLQFRHSLATARGGRARGWPLTFAVLTVLAVGPDWWLRYDWVPMVWFVIASALMVLPRRAGPIAAAAALAGAAAWAVTADFDTGFTVAGVLPYVPYYLAVFGLGGVALFASARLAAILSDLFAARTELAEQALARERLRVSRDLHDLLGQSLSAVSLKGDLAIRLLATDPPAAHREIESLTGVARSALRDMRAVMRDEHEVSLAAEAEAAQAVLAAAGVAVHVGLAVPGLAPGPDAVLAWAVREGATNILRHSQARRAGLTAGRADGLVWLEMINDGAAGRAGQGTGLAGLASRARSAGGTMTAGYAEAGTFRLRVEIPEEAT
jgi:two-component system sensor histidine kinase DesK